MKIVTMLINKLYTIRHLEIGQDRSGIVADIELDPHHPVFEGHFPGNPLLPGVCTVQIIKELLEEAFKESLVMTRAKSIKYLGFVDPGLMPVLRFDLRIGVAEEGAIQCSAAVSVRETGVCSFKGEFRNSSC
jgi:3-hydroxyacyl-[acyl-carrier-protein] dehydratase